MDFRIADTFTDSLARLTGDEQKGVKTTAFDLQVNPANPSHKLHKLDRAQDSNFWSVRVSRDIRIIIHKTSASLMLCYVDHHDKAYKWAERRKLQTHPKTGAAQLVEIRERVEEIKIPVYVEVKQAAPEKALLFKTYSDDELLGYGVPPEWLEDVKLSNEDSLLELADHLPVEASEALLELAVGSIPIPATVAGDKLDPFNHPDAQRRFRVMNDIEALERALDFPWEKWTIFLHPEQTALVEKDYNGPVRVSGSAGTGKTIVALHRAVFLTRNNPDARVLLTTFSDPLANALRSKLKILLSNEPRLGERLEIQAMNAVGRRLYKSKIGKLTLVEDEEIKSIIANVSQKMEGNTFSQRFIFDEWQQVVDAWQIANWEDYRDVKRLGRKTRLPENKRLILWSIYEHVQSELRNGKKITMAGIFAELSEKFNSNKKVPFDHIIVDESQDINVPQLRFMAALAGGRANSLFFAGDLGQRIFQQAFSWKSLGVDIRGRSWTLRVNYRTSHQIRLQADRLLGPAVSDVDGNVEDRRGTVSVFNGPAPVIQQFNSFDDEAKAVGEWLMELVEEGYLPHEIGIFVRSDDEMSRAKSALENTEIPYKVLDDYIEVTQSNAALTTMHFAKGLEFRAVVVMGCDDEVIPSQKRIENVSDNADLDEVYETERHLLYVACTRARDRLLITSGEVPSEFLEDMRSKK
jgi:hypothetical protein